jgi:lambda family phage tail tape measure protein
MATNDTVVLYFKLSDLGETIKGNHKELKAFRSTFDSLQKDMSKPSGGGGGGWKKAAMGGNEYDIARGSAGATGASGRDFANQARGLDGLVRLYATYAANVFAAGAAFRALSEAADTTNMINGMNQLGAASGLALGSIAKNLRDATDGAISMREAIEATTKGTAAGLSAKQMEQLGQVANKASKALGIAMPDAISRLTRGISKLEPELLDELGLFTKIGPATENYARSIGRSVSSLTDFERRQAFANAVLKEGIDKFNSIEIAANPYDKLLASLKDLSFKALEVVNKVFTPLVAILSANPTALLAVLTAIGVSILKTAIPALGQYRENLKRTADESRLTFSKMYADQQMAFSNLSIDQGAMAEATFRNAKDTQSRIQKLAKEGSTFTKGKKIDYGALASKDPFALTPAEIKSLENRAKYLATKNAEEAARLRKHLADLKAIRAESAMKGDVAAQASIEGSEKWYSTALANDIINKKKLQTLSVQTIRSNVAETQSLLGMRAAWKKLNDDTNLARAGLLKVQTGIDENGKAVTQTAPKINILQAGYTKLAGGVGIVVQKLATTVSAFGHIGMAVGAAIAAFTLLDSWLTKTEKETDSFNKAMGGTTDAVDSANRTLAALAKQPGIATASIQGILALSNASNTVTDAIETQLDATKQLLNALNSSIWDRAKDKIAGLFGKDIASESAKNLASSVQAQLKLFREAGMGDEAEAGFKKAIGVSSLDIDTVTAAFKNSSTAQDEFAKSNKNLNVRLLETSSNLQNFKTATEAVTKAYDEFIQSTASSNPLFKIGAALEDLSVTMDKLSSGSIQEINAAFNDLVDNPKKIAQFGKGFIDQFVAIRQEFKTTLQDYSAYAQSLSGIQDRIDQITEQRKNAKDISTPVMAGRGMGTKVITAEEQRQGYDKQLGLLQGNKKAVTELQLGLNTEIFTKARDLFTKGVTDSFEKGSEFIRLALGQASQKAGITIAQASLGALTGARAAQENTRIKQQELKLQMDQVRSTIDLIASNTLLTATMAESNALQADAIANKSGAPREVRSEAGAALTASKIFKNAVAEVSAGKIKPEDLDKILTGNTQVDKYIQQALIPFKRQIAQQRATGIEIGGKQKATSIEGARAEALGKLEDLNKQRNLESDINQQLSARIDILASIDNLNGAQRAQERADLEDKILNNKQLQEREGYETAISNAKALNTVKGNEEAKVQEGLLTLVKDRQKIEKDNKAFSDRVKIKAAELDTAIKLNALNEALTDQDIARLGIISSLIGFSSEQNVLATTRLENEKLENKFTLERKKIEEDIKLLQSDTTKDNSKSIALQQTNLALVTARQEKEKDNKGLQDALKLVEARFDLEQKLAGFRKTAADAQSQQAEDDLNYRKELGLVTGFDAVKEKANIDRGRVARETAQEQASIDKDIAKKTLLEQKILDIEASGDSALAGDYEAVNNMTNSINAQSAALQATNQQKMNAIDLNEKLGSKMTGFSKIVEGSFQNMADALADFAKTGKLDFKSLVDQMILDLIRFEMRAQMSSLFSAAGGLSGLMKFIGFGGASGMGASPDGINVGNNLLVQAKGGAYDTGLKTFAKGGMFTNSVVSQPTLFKFAQGTGLMGEAGPEAIMPLKRDSNGNLGVRGPGGSGGNVDVVVNNYGNEKATTKETTDSRGNRRIEVIVGDMVASELSRPGSSVQQSLSSNYGNKPSVARR